MSNRGPSAYQPNALPLGQTGSLGQTGLHAYIPPLPFIPLLSPFHKRSRPSVVTPLHKTGSAVVFARLANQFVLTNSVTDFETSVAKNSIIPSTRRPAGA